MKRVKLQTAQPANNGELDKGGTSMSTGNPKKDPIEESTDNKNVSGTPPSAAPDPFNAKALRLPPAFEQNAGVRKVISTIPVRKPHSQEWIRVRRRWRPAGHSRESGASLAPGLARLHASRLMLMCVSPVLRIHRNSLGLLSAKASPPTSGRWLHTSAAPRKRWLEGRNLACRLRARSSCEYLSVRNANIRAIGERHVPPHA